MTDFREQAKRYLVLVEGGPPSNFSAWSPDVPGCVATGSSVDECAADMRAAIAFHLESMAADGEPLPDAASGSGVYVAHAA